MRLSMRVWDLPLRLFHWAITLLLIAAYATWRTHHLRWHVLIGEAALALLLWRITWGFAGSDTARFRAFLRSPLEALQPATARPDDNRLDHGRAGGWWTFVMLALIAAQSLSGLFGAGPTAPPGPLAALLPAAAAAALGRLHATLLWALAAAIALHLLAIAAAAARGHNLLRPMLSGKKRMPAAMRAPRMASTSLAALILLSAAGIVVLVVDGLAR